MKTWKFQWHYEDDALELTHVKCLIFHNFLEIYEIARRIGHEWFGIGIRLGYDHSLLETLESMYVTEHARRNFKMIACWCKIVSNLQLNVRQHLAFHLSEASRQDIADDIGVYYKGNPYTSQFCNIYQKHWFSYLFGQLIYLFIIIPFLNFCFLL